MTWLNSIFIALLTGGLGLLCGGLVMGGCVRWHNVSNFEGKASYMVAGVALLGGIAGLLIGLVTARVVAAGVSPTFIQALKMSAGIVVGVAALAAGLAWLTGDHSARAQPPSPAAAGPTFAEQEAAKVSEEQATFDAIPPDAPLTAWLDYTKYGASEERQAAVLQRITAKPGWVAELSDLMVTDDARISDTALRTVYHLPQPPKEFVAAVSAAGRHLAEQMRQVNATTVEQDPGYHGAADVAIRFGGWMAAVRTLREKCGGDFVPELREILELSRVRTDSQVMRTDVRRVASYYAKEWAGLEPLPGDPPPK